MKNSISKVAYILLFSYVFLSCSKNSNPVVEPSEAQFSAATLSKLDSAFNKAMTTYEIPGAIVAIWTPSGNYIKAKGFSNLATNEPMSVTNHFRIGSVTKTFTGTLVLKLVEEGKINLDSSLAYYLPQYNFPKANKITVRMLGNMTSGIYDCTKDPSWVQSNLANNWETVYTADSLVKVALQYPLDFEPGTNYSYTNTTPLLLGLICEKVTGKLIQDLFDEKIFQPYELDNTFWPNNRYLPEPYSHGYSKANSSHEFKDMSFLNPSYAGASGNLISNISDLKNWVQLLGKGSLYSSSMQLERLKWAIGSSYYGFAIQNATNPDLLILGHSGAIWGYSTMAFYTPSIDLTIVIHVNYYSRGESNPANSLFSDMINAL